ncbi:hypothetical protein K7G91_000913 [Pasteurella canis]|uniref:hypothetical protein n=1 Tax=Pasteurella canis TaxID=753 RepID=UPI00066974DA|nr:hypothetical protein [Pasteurella canis]UDW84626.1 hypothetical protein K7G91_000913 [Pasteurella canis]
MVTPETELEFLKDVLLDNDDAIDLALSLGRASQFIDDIIDKDKPMSNAEIGIGFLNILINLPRNRFYLDHLPELTPILYTAMADYIASTEMENSDNDHTKNLAFVLRDSLIAVVIYLAGVVGGDMYGLTAASKIRNFYHDETLEQYKGGLK